MNLGRFDQVDVDGLRRLTAPMSRLPAAEWVREDTATPKLSTMDKAQRAGRGGAG
jgi:hypothetical protein